MTDWSGRPAYAQVADTLRADIRAGRYPPGSQLPSYEALMRKHGVSITVIRSAVRELKTEGLVYTHQGKGAFVRDPLPEPGAAPAVTSPVRPTGPSWPKSGPFMTTSTGSTSGCHGLSGWCGQTQTEPPPQARLRRSRNWSSRLPSARRLTATAASSLGERWPGLVPEATSAGPRSTWPVALVLGSPGFAMASMCGDTQDTGTALTGRMGRLTMSNVPNDLWGVALPNERLRAALARDGWTVSAFAEAVEVDPKTVERWITKERTPHRRIAIAAAKQLGEDPLYLWPDLDRRVITDDTYGEILTVYTERSAVPKLAMALPAPGRAAERGHPRLRRAAPARSASLVGQGDPEEMRRRRTRAHSHLVTLTARKSARAGRKKGVGEGLAARIRYALAWHRPIFESPDLSIALHSTVLYNSILRFDDQMLVNPHIYSIPAFRAPVLHLRRIQGGPLFDTYVECFENVWAQARQFDPAKDL